MKRTLIIFSFMLQILATHSLLIVPDEVPSLLSVVYSNIPTIKKGTDSRWGWGFRLGNRADFQVLMELGPQTYTQPIRQIPNPLSSSKRNVPNSLRNILYAQQQRNKQISNTDGGKWIDQWRQTMQNVPEAKVLPEGVKPGLAAGEIDAKSVIPDDATLMLQELYKKKTKEGEKKDEVKVTTQTPKTTTSAKEALDNVDME